MSSVAMCGSCGEVYDEATTLHRCPAYAVGKWQIDPFDGPMPDLNTGRVLELEYRTTAPPPVEVTGCQDCPMFNGEGFCRHPATQDDCWQGHADTATPAWCPLRSGPVVVRLRVP